MPTDRITVDAARMAGQPTLSGTRLTVAMVIGQLAGGRTIDDLLHDYPYLDRLDVLSALRHAAVVVNGRAGRAGSTGGWLGVAPVGADLQVRGRGGRWSRRR